jgi:hypothetical protein
MLDSNVDNRLKLIGHIDTTNARVEYNRALSNGLSKC